MCKKTGKECQKNCHSVVEDTETESLIEDFVQIDNIIMLNFGTTKFCKVYEENDIFKVLDEYGADSYMFVDGNTGKGKRYSFCLFIQVPTRTWINKH